MQPQGLPNKPAGCYLSLQSKVILLSTACLQANQLTLASAKLHAIVTTPSLNNTCNRNRHIHVQLPLPVNREDALQSLL